MEKIFELQLPLMVFLQNLRTEAMNGVVEFVTSLGEMYITLVVIMLLFWCIDKKKGFKVGASVLTATVTMQTLKAIFRVPRPFMMYPDQVTGLRQETATGYSFPSGHSTTASSFYGGLYKAFKEKWIRIISLILIIAIPLTRLYLGVHWPMDVIVGTALGVFFSIGMSKVYDRIYSDTALFNKVMLIAGTVTAVTAVVLGIALDWTEIDYRAVHNLQQNSAITAGAAFGLFLDRKKLNFIPAKTAKTRVLSCVVGLISGGACAFILLSIPFMHYLFETFAYALLGLWVSFLFPLFAVKFGWMEKA